MLKVRILFFAKQGMLLMDEIWMSLAHKGQGLATDHECSSCQLLHFDTHCPSAVGFYGQGAIIIIIGATNSLFLVAATRS